MEMLYMILPKNIVDRAIADVKVAIKKYSIRTKQDLNKHMKEDYDYWYPEVMMNGNPIQEAIVLDSLWRIIYCMSPTSSPYN